MLILSISRISQPSHSLQKSVYELVLDRTSKFVFIQNKDVPMKKAIHFMLALCSMICMVMPASAVEAFASVPILDVPIHTEPIENVHVLNLELSSSLMGDSAQTAINPANPVESNSVIVAEGCHVVPYSVYLYPAYYEAGVGFQDFDTTIYHYQINNNTGSGSTTVNLSCKTTSSKVSELMSKFQEKFGHAANTWVLFSTFHIYTDGKGSYPEYFKMYPYGNPVLMNVGSDGRVTYSVKKNTSSQSATITTCYEIEDTSARYTIGLRGSLYYYNVNNGKHLAADTGGTAIINY